MTNLVDSAEPIKMADLAKMANPSKKADPVKTILNANGAMQS